MIESVSVCINRNLANDMLKNYPTAPWINTADKKELEKKILTNPSKPWKNKCHIQWLDMWKNISNSDRWLSQIHSKKGSPQKKLGLLIVQQPATKCKSANVIRHNSTCKAKQAIALQILELISRMGLFKTHFDAQNCHQKYKAKHQSINAFKLISNQKLPRNSTDCK